LVPFFGQIEKKIQNKIQFSSQTISRKSTIPTTPLFLYLRSKTNNIFPEVVINSLRQKIGVYFKNILPPTEKGAFPKSYLQILLSGKWQVPMSFLGKINIYGSGSQPGCREESSGVPPNIEFTSFLLLRVPHNVILAR